MAHGLGTAGVKRPITTTGAKEPKSKIPRVEIPTLQPKTVQRVGGSYSYAEPKDITAVQEPQQAMPVDPVATKTGRLEMLQGSEVRVESVAPVELEKTSPTAGIPLEQTTAEKILEQPKTPEKVPEPSSEAEIIPRQENNTPKPVENPQDPEPSKNETAAALDNAALDNVVSLKSSSGDIFGDDPFMDEKIPEAQNRA